MSSPNLENKKKYKIILKKNTTTTTTTRTRTRARARTTTSTRSQQEVNKILVKSPKSAKKKIWVNSGSTGFFMFHSFSATPTACKLWFMASPFFPLCLTVQIKPERPAAVLFNIQRWLRKQMGTVVTLVQNRLPIPSNHLNPALQSVSRRRRAYLAHHHVRAKRNKGNKGSSRLRVPINSLQTCGCLWLKLCNL